MVRQLLCVPKKVAKACRRERTDPKRVCKSCPENQMRRAAAFVKKTGRGNVVKVVREHYLRDDIICGSALCAPCKQISDQLQADVRAQTVASEADKSTSTPTPSKAKLSSSFKSSSSSSSDDGSELYIIVDTTVALQQMDWIEQGNRVERLLFIVVLYV